MSLDINSYSITHTNPNLFTIQCKTCYVKRIGILDNYGIDNALKSFCHNESCNNQNDVFSLKNTIIEKFVIPVLSIPKPIINIKKTNSM